MIISWTPVVVTDIVGSVLTLLIAVLCVYRAWEWLRRKPNDIFRHYLFLLTFAFVLFAVSRSFGHLVKQILDLRGLDHLWRQISPFSGAVNTTTFVIAASFSIYFNRLQKVHQEIEKYKNSLESLVEKRTRMLEESHATLETVLNSANPICMVNLDFEIIDANKAYYEIWPKQSATGEKMKCYESRPGRTCATSSCPVKLIKGGTEEVVNKQSKDFDGGETRDFIITARPFRDPEGRLIGVVESFQDITDQERAAAELMAEREQLNVTLRSLGEGVITTDTTGNITLINKAAEEITGWSQEDALGRPFEEVFNVFDEDPDSTVDQPMDKTISSGYETIAKPKRLVTRDGEQKLVSERGAPIRDVESRVTGIVLVFRDVTEQRRMEEEFAKIQKLESVGILAGGIAHDFNNILTAIVGNINLAMSRVDQEDPVHDLLASAEKASNRARNLTMQLLTFSSGGEPVKKIATIQDIIRDSASFILRGSNVQCGYKFAENIWTVEIDPGQIGQVIQNITMNGDAAMADGGTIEIECNNYLQEEASPVLAAGQYVRIAIRDQGAGIPPEIIDRIFDPFFSTKEEGSGLGLATTHSIISKHQGHIEVDSELGKGTVFTIYLPASGEAVAVSKGKEAKPQEGGGGRRIMVMDDDEMIRSLVGKMLSMLGYETLFAGDGKEAIRIYLDAHERKEEIALTIMDLTIPGGMGGKEAVSEFLKIDPEAKIIVSSGYSNDPIISNFKDYGFRAAMTKPFKLKDLQEALGEVLGEE